jgi:hypothetical protein
MNLERLPEIVERVGVTRPDKPGLILRWFDYDKKPTWAYHGSESVAESVNPHDAANACVVAMLGRCAATTDYAVAVASDGILMIDCKMVTKAKFPGDLLNALYDAFLSHPDWFKEQA